MQLEINNEQDFERLLEDLMDELMKARTHYAIYCDLLDSIEVYEREMNYSPAFWTMTLQAHLDAALVSLCRIYEQNKREPYTLNLRNFLETIRENLGLFDEARFRERLKENK
jgi:HEPN superfamily AbiU2-like protein